MTETPKKPRTPEMRLAKALRATRELSTEQLTLAYNLSFLTPSLSAKVVTAARAIHDCEDEDAASVMALRPAPTNED